MASIQDIKTYGAAAANAAGYAVKGIGTRLNGTGETSFLWELTKGGVTYRLQHEVNLNNVDQAALNVFPTLFKTYMADMKAE